MYISTRGKNNIFWRLKLLKLELLLMVDFCANDSA